MVQEGYFTGWRITRIDLIKVLLHFFFSARRATSPAEEITERSARGYENGNHCFEPLQSANVVQQFALAKARETGHEK